MLKVIVNPSFKGQKQWAIGLNWGLIVDGSGRGGMGSIIYITQQGFFPL